MRVAALALLTLGCLFCSGGGGTRHEQRILVSAAVSLAPALDDAARSFERVRPGVRVELTTGGSGLLVQQILRGAPVHLFISASAAEIDRLQAAGLLVDGSRAAIASNRLVVTVPHGRRSPSSMADLASGSWARIAVANPRTAPLGRYTEQALRGGGVLEQVEDRLVFAQDARQALQYVARGEVDAGIVYASDTPVAAVDVALTLPDDTHDPIRYEAALLGVGGGHDRAAALLSFLESEPGRSSLARHGLGPLP